MDITNTYVKFHGTDKDFAEIIYTSIADLIDCGPPIDDNGDDMEASEELYEMVGGEFFMIEEG